MELEELLGLSSVIKSSPQLNSLISTPQLISSPSSDFTPITTKSVTATPQQQTNSSRDSEIVLLKEEISKLKFEKEDLKAKIPTQNLVEMKFKLDAALLEVDALKRQLENEKNAKKRISLILDSKIDEIREISRKDDKEIKFKNINNKLQKELIKLYREKGIGQELIREKLAELNAE